MVGKNIRTLALATLASLATSAWADRIVMTPIDLDNVHLSSDAHVAAGWRWEGDVVKSYAWSAEGGYLPLGRETWDVLNTVMDPAVSGDGTTIAQTIVSESGKYATAGVWTPADGWRQLIPAGAGIIGNHADSYAYGISRDGKVVTGQFNVADGMAHGFAWSADSGLVDMGTVNGYSAVLGANADGSVLVGWDGLSALLPRAVVWNDGVPTLLDDDYGVARAVNADGTIIVGNSGTFLEEVPALWRRQDGRWVRTLLTAAAHPDVPPPFGWATALSDDGRIVVGSGTTLVHPQHSHSTTAIGFVWTAATGLISTKNYFQGLDYSSMTFVYATPSITPNGATLAAQGGGCGVATCLISRVP